MHEINIRTYLMYKINSINMGIDDFTIRNFRNFMFNDVYRYFEEKQIGNEYIYESKIGRINEYMCIIRVYSSIDTKSDRVRDSGKDAIRVNICDKYGDTLLLDNERYKHVNHLDVKHRGILLYY